MSRVPPPPVLPPAPPEPPLAPTLEAAIQGRIDQLEGERALLIADAYDAIAREEQALAPYLARMHQLDAARASLTARVAAYNGTINELRALLPAQPDPSGGGVPPADPTKQQGDTTHG